MNRRAFLGGLGAAASLGLAGCLAGGTGGTGGQDYDVSMSSAAFEPSRLEVTAGETVVWLNTNSRAHTVTAYDDGIPEGAEYFASGGYDSEFAARDAYVESFGGAIGSQDTFEHTFAVPGQYDYFCIPHEKAGMVGTIVVRE